MPSGANITSGALKLRGQGGGGQIDLGADWLPDSEKYPKSGKEGENWEKRKNREEKARIFHFALPRPLRLATPLKLRPLGLSFITLSSSDK